MALNIIKESTRSLSAGAALLLIASFSACSLSSEAVWWLALLSAISLSEGSLWVSLSLVWVTSLLACYLLSQFAKLYMASPKCLGGLLMIHTIPWVRGLIHHHRAVAIADGTYLVMGTKSHPYIEAWCLSPIMGTRSDPKPVGCYNCTHNGYKILLTL